MSEKIKRELQDVGDFTRIAFYCWGDITLQQGDTCQVVVEAEEEFLDHLEIYVEDNTLVIEFDDEAHRLKWKHAVREKRSINYTITLPQLESIKIAGHGSLTADTLTGDRIALIVSGAGNIKINALQYKRIAFDITGTSKSTINTIMADEIGLSVKGTCNLTVNEVKADSLVTSIKGMGTITMAGRVNKQSLSVPGSGNLDFQHLETDTLQLISQGMTNATLWIQDALNAKIYGVGNIRYYGNPTIKKEVRGVAQIKRRGERPRVTA